MRSMELDDFAQYLKDFYSRHGWGFYRVQEYRRGQGRSDIHFSGLTPRERKSEQGTEMLVREGVRRGARLGTS